MLKFPFIQTVCPPVDILIQHLSNINHKIYSLALRAGPYLIPHHFFQSLQLRLIQAVGKTKFLFQYCITRSITNHVLLILARTPPHKRPLWSGLGTSLRQVPLNLTSRMKLWVLGRIPFAVKYLEQFPLKYHKDGINL